MTVITMSRNELSRLQILIGLADGRTRVDDAAALMGMPLDAVQVEVKKASRSAARSTRVIAGEQGAQRSIIVERKVSRRIVGNDKRVGA